MAEPKQTANDPAESEPNTSITTPDLLETPEKSFDDVRPVDSACETAA